MTLHTRSRRSGAILGVASLAALAVTGIVQAGSADAATGNPYSPAAGHSYRHGVIPTIGTQAKMNAYAKAHPATITATGPQTLSYGGGIDGIGVHERPLQGLPDLLRQPVGHPDHRRQRQRQVHRRLGRRGRRRPADVQGHRHQQRAVVGRPDPVVRRRRRGDRRDQLPGLGRQLHPLPDRWRAVRRLVRQLGRLTGHGQRSPARPVEAVNAAAHFGNTTAASNRYAYYVILSPHGTNPDSYQGQYCAWHDYNGDTTLTGGAVSSPYGDIAFSNQPYNIDSGAGCGVGFVNSPGTLDGWTMTLGHEWHEMMSDQNPAGGWTNHTGQLLQRPGELRRVRLDVARHRRRRREHLLRLVRHLRRAGQLVQRHQQLRHHRTPSSPTAPAA